MQGLPSLYNFPAIAKAALIIKNHKLTRTIYNLSIKAKKRRNGLNIVTQTPIRAAVIA